MARNGYRIGVKSIDVGIDLVFKLAQASQPMSLKDLSARTNMSPGKAHRYLVSLLRTGIVSQSPDTRLYELGPMAIHLGLVAMGRSTIIDQASRLCMAVRDEVGETTVLTVWGNNGPTVVHVEDNHDTIVVTVRVGTALPVIDTAAGRIFAAFQSAADVEPLLEREFADTGKARETDEMMSRERFAAVVAEVRGHRQSIITGFRALGVSTISSPLMFPAGNLVAALTVIGRSERLAHGLDGPIAKALRLAADRFPLEAASTRRARAVIANP